MTANLTPEALRALADRLIPRLGWQGDLIDEVILALRAIADRDASLAARGFAEGVEAAAKFVADRAQNYHEEHGIYDGSTGITEYPGTGDEYMGELAEIEEGIRSLTPPAGCEHKEEEPKTCLGYVNLYAFEDDEYLGSTTIYATEAAARHNAAKGPSAGYRGAVMLVPLPDRAREPHAGEEDGR